MRLFLLSLLFLTVASLYTNAQQNGAFRINSFKPGYYYTNDGIKHQGKIERSAEIYSVPDSGSYNYILLKTDTGKTEVPFSDLQSFIIEKDSFVVSQKTLIAYKVELNTPVKIYSYAMLNYNTPMIMNNGIMMTTGPRKITTYFYGSSPDSVTELRHKNFIDVMSVIMADKPKVVEKIKDKTYRYVDLDDLLIFYITGVRPTYPSVVSRGYSSK